MESRTDGPARRPKHLIISCEGDASSNTLQSRAVEKWRGQGHSVSEATWDLTASPEELSAEADKMRAGAITCFHPPHGRQPPRHVVRGLRHRRSAGVKLFERINSFLRTMKNASLYIDLAFCLGFLPLMIFAFPVERWWGTYPVFFCSFVGWLYATYFSYKYFIVPRLFHKGRPRMLRPDGDCRLPAGHVPLLVLRNIVAVLPCPAAAGGDSRSELGRAAESAGHLAALYHRRDLLLRRRHADGSLPPAAGPRGGGVQRNKAELALYKAQINPHFLFNTLNALYGLLITRSDKTEATLERFINLTKYIQQRQSRFHTARRGGGVHRPVYRLANLCG